jgi:hypothetical protein
MKLQQFAHVLLVSSMALIALVPQRKFYIPVFVHTIRQHGRA